MKKVILLCGQKQAGKDTFAAMLSAQARVVRVAHADPLKWMADPIVREITGKGVRELSAEEKEKIRPFLQSLGATARRFDPDFWVDKAVKEGRYYTHTGVSLVITDLRFPNELRAWREAYPDSVLVRITRPGLSDDDPDESEHAWRGLPFDEVIVNDGTLEDFRQKALDFAKREGLLHDPS